MADIARRTALLGAAAVSLGAASATSAWEFSFSSIEEGILRLSDWRGRVLLVANTASFCGYTYQYKALQALHDDLAPRGLVVLGVPSQDFAQESDSNAKVKHFCEATFGVAFPLAGLTHVRGAQAHPFYAWVRANRGWEPGWNFNKVLIGRDGFIAGLFGADDEPDGAKLRGAILASLAATV